MSTPARVAWSAVVIATCRAICREPLQFLRLIPRACSDDLEFNVHVTPME